MEQAPGAFEGSRSANCPSCRPYGNGQSGQICGRTETDGWAIGRWPSRAPLSSPLNESEYKRVFAELRRQRADALIVTDLTENYANRAIILELVGAMRLPSIYPLRDYIPLGGLLSYGSDPADFWRSAAVQIDHIFRGARAGDIPFNQPTKFTLP